MVDIYCVNQSEKCKLLFKAALGTLPGWRAIKMKVASVATALKDALKEVAQDCTVAFQMLDSA